MESPHKKFKLVTTHCVQDCFSNQQIGELECSSVELSPEEAFLCSGVFEFGETLSVEAHEFIKAYNMFIQDDNGYPKKRRTHKLFEGCLAEQSCSWDFKTSIVTGLQFHKKPVSSLQGAVEYLNMNVFTNAQIMNVLVPWDIVCEDVKSSMDGYFAVTMQLTKQKPSLQSWVKQIVKNDRLIVLYNCKTPKRITIPTIYGTVKKMLIIN